VLVIVLLARHALLTAGGPQGLSKEYGAAAPVMSTLLLAGSSWFFLPTEFIAAGQGAAYGFVLGSFTNWLGWLLSSIIQFGLVKYGAAGRSGERMRGRLPKRLRALPPEHPIVLIVGRQLPFGSTIIDTMAPLTGVSWWRHIWCAAIAIAPLAMICGAVGAALV
jgi:uncharacterized membrane protein YdjX (TVP38/TMEM64 family)